MFATNVGEKNLISIEPNTPEDAKQKSCIIPSTIDDHLLRYDYFWQQYYADMRSPKKFIPMGGLLLIVLYYYMSTPSVSLPNSLASCIGNPQASLHSSIVACLEDPNIFPDADKTSLIDYYVIGIFNLSAAYFLGLMLWLLSASGRHIRSLAQHWRFKIDPLHPDGCGGFKPLGDYCLQALYPFVVGAAFFVSLLVGHWASNSLSLADLFVLVMLLVCCIPGIYLAFALPLWDIRERMESERDEDEAKFLREIEALKSKIEGLLYGHGSDEATVLKGKLDEVNVLKEKKELIEALYTSNPTLPFAIHWAALGSIGTLLWGTFSGVIVFVLEQTLTRR